ncbi:MAG: class I SAM-dependent DNA methyltransferase [Planctomycetota bacterium]
MKGFGIDSFGELYADRYDEANKQSMEAATRDSVEFLADLAGGGTVLELAIGTGRVALPLAARGLSVRGIEASEKMVAKLREKPGGDAIPVTIGDMADVAVEGEFDLIFLVFNTIFNLTSQEAQVRLFENVARRLTDGGVFVVETFMPQVELNGFINGRAVRGKRATRDMAAFEVVEHDPVAQTFDYQRVFITEEGTRLAPLAMRYAYPSELDLMARLAGLAMRDRWGWWDRSPFTAESTSHVSVYARASRS